MKVLIIGNGGREHALAWKISQSPLVKQIFSAPGNPGMAELGENIPIKVGETDKLVQFALEKSIDLTVVGPEVPLVDGIVDVFQEKQLRIFGPVAKAAHLEGSKSFAKNLMEKYQIPTAGYAEFTESGAAKDYLINNNTYPIVLKADGLAAGKGVLICMNQQEAFDGLKLIMEDKAFGNAGETLVIEDFLEGEEVSIFALCDGNDYLLFPPSQDHKKIGEGDTGKNTGGMGAYAPAPVFTAELQDEVEKTIIQKSLQAMRSEGTPYKGLLYFGLIIKAGKPFVLEYNCRFGDPETEAVLPLIESDLVPLFQASIDGDLKNHTMKIKNQSAMDVVMASGGYPDSYQKGYEISGLNDQNSDILVFHAGTEKYKEKTVTSGGRVLNIVALGKDLQSAREKVYGSITNIDFKDCYYRRDIGFRAL